MEEIVMIRATILFGVLLVCNPAGAQDVPGLETCTRESKMERRTGCLQSNVEFLHQLIRKSTLESQQKLAAASNEIATLKSTIAELQAAIVKLQAQNPEMPKADKK
jgi:hypothetical protein